jgi:predicted GNAT family acetyltransferase
MTDDSRRDADIQVQDDPGQEAFEIVVDGELAGVAVYQRRGEDYAFMHTKVDDRFEGRGLGSMLVRGALDTVREQGVHALPYCPFVLDYMQRHPEYLELVPTEARGQFGLLS